MKRLNIQGFTGLAALLLVILIAVIGGTGWYVYNSQKKADSPSQAPPITNFDECVAAGNPVMESSPEQCAANGQTFAKEAARPFEIAEWGVIMTVGEELLDAEYELKDNTARLSTKAFRDDPMCKKLQDEDPSIQMSFNSITRYTGEEDLDPWSKEPGITNVAEAAAKYPEFFKEIGEYYYHYSHGNATPCSTEHARADEFKAAFQTLKASE